MTMIDLSPLYRSSVGFDRLASLLDTALRSEQSADQSKDDYPSYDIEVHNENQYAITLAVAGFERNELDIQVEKGVLSVSGKCTADNDNAQYLYQGISHRPFERKFNLADYVEVTGADLNNGLLTINLVKEIPEAMKPKSIEISYTDKSVIEHKEDDKAA
jgi:molecular chaperone IbpA